MPDDYEYKIVRVPALETGIGQEAGYASDKEFVAAVNAERQAMHPALRATLDRIDRAMTDTYLRESTDQTLGGHQNHQR